MSLLHKTKKQQKNNDPIIRLMMPMVAGVLACIFCLVSMTWAWFTASVDTPPQTIQSANRSTSVVVYAVSQSEDENKNVTKTLVKPKVTEGVSLAESTEEADKDASVVMAGESAIWELSPEKTYEIVMKGSGTASTGYCKVALSHTLSGSDKAETKLYTTSAFERDNTVRFTYNTGGFSNVEGVTETEYKEYIEKTTPPTLTIASFWGKPAENETEQVALMSLRSKAKEEIMLLSDGDVLGLAPIPCPEAKAETEIELDGFETEKGAVISAEEDYQISLTLKEGYEMPSEVVVNINGNDYIVSTEGGEPNEEAPYYDAGTGILTVPSSLLRDGATVSVKGVATPIGEEETADEQTEAETEDVADNSAAVDNTIKKEEDSELESDEPKRIPIGSGGNDDEDDNDNSDGSSMGDTSSSDSIGDETDDEKADVTLNLSRLTINLEETQIPTNADLVFTLSAKEDMELPENIVITLDKTIRNENIDDEKIEEDKTEYIINTDGNDNPEGFEFDAESGELTISSELLLGVREITITDTEKTDVDEKATITFEVKNLTFDFVGDEIVTEQDIIITFTAGAGYELPETIVITIDGVEYIVYTSEEDSDKNPEGITFDTESGTLTISKDLLEDVKSITITAESIEKENDESEDESPDTDSKDESDNKENESDGGETTDKETENETNTPDSEDKTETEGEPDDENADNAQTSNPEINPDDSTDSGDNSETENSGPDTESSDSTTQDSEDNSSGGQGSESKDTEDNSEAENGTEEPTESAPGTENGGDEENGSSTEPNAGENVSYDNGRAGSVDNSLTESNNKDSQNSTDSKENNDGQDSNTISGSTELPAPTNSAPAISETTTPDASPQTKDNLSSANRDLNESSEMSDTTTSSKE